MEKFGKLMAIVLTMIIVPIVKGFVFSKLWLWFMVKPFQLHPLDVFESIGVMILIYFIRVKRDKELENEVLWESFAENIIFTVLMAGFALLSGWIVTHFI